VNGTPGIDVVRSSSAPGISVVRVVFNRGTNPTQARQLVNEQLQTLQSRFPEGTEAPQVSPPTSPISTIVQ
jgi:Cu/Ag efflux pump CusA